MRIAKFFDRLEDIIRGWLSHHPFIYALYGGTGLVLFERGIWHGMDALAEYLSTPLGVTTRDAAISFQDSGISLIIGTIIMLSCGILVSQFIGNEIILSGLRGEKRLTERTETEVRTETGALAEVLERLDVVMIRLEELEAYHHGEESKKK